MAASPSQPDTTRFFDTCICLHSGNTQTSANLFMLKYREHTLNQFKQLGLDQQRALKLARSLHAHSVKYARKLVITRRAIENKTSQSQVLEPGASSNPPDPH
eukprot:1146249-Pelagomonas_calceolata.AAC.2